MESTEESSAAVTEITWWAFPTFGVDTGYEQEVVDAFNTSHSDIKVKVEYLDFTSGPDKLTAALTSDTAPDILFDAPAVSLSLARQDTWFPWMTCWVTLRATLPASHLWKPAWRGRHSLDVSDFFLPILYGSKQGSAGEGRCASVREPGRRPYLDNGKLC